jgi:hypothetical protein
MLKPSGRIRIREVVSIVIEMAGGEPAAEDPTTRTRVQEKPRKDEVT